MTALQQFWYSRAAVGPAVTVDATGDTVTAAAAADTATAWLWDWGDGTTSTGRTPPPHTYSTPYPHTIALTTTYTSADGCRMYQTTTYTVVEDTAPPQCFELVQIETQQFDPVLGMAAPGAASNARTYFLSLLQSYESANMDHLTGGPVETTTRISSNLPRPIWSGLGTMTTDNRFAVAYVGSTVASSAYPGRFNTTSVSGGNWLDSDASINIALSSPRNAFCCYVTDLGDFSATLEFQFRLGTTLVKTVVIPYEDLNTSEVMHVGYLDGAKMFDRIRIQINQNDPNAIFDNVGFDDLVIGVTLPCTPGSP